MLVQIPVTFVGSFPSAYSNVDVDVESYKCMVRERGIPTELAVSDPVQGIGVGKSDVIDLTPVGEPESRSVANVAPVQVRSR